MNSVITIISIVLVKKTISITSLIAFLTRRHNSTRKCQQLASAHGISGYFDYGDVVDVVDIVDIVDNVDVVDDDVVDSVNSWQAHMEYQVIVMIGSQPFKLINKSCLLE